MSTYPNSYPQPGAPPTPISTRQRKFDPAMNLPEIVAIEKLPGDLVPSEFGASEVRFRLTDGRPWYAPQVIADEIYRARIAPRQQFEVTKTGKTKADLRIVPLDAHLGGAAAQTAAPLPATTTQQQQNHNPATPPPAPPAISPAANKLMACFMQSIDAIAEAQQYANRRGLGITFSSEDVRATAISCWISACRDGGAR